MNIAVYLGSNTGNDPVYKQAILELGEWIGRNGHHLIYGGSKTGLMGILAQSVLDNGGLVTGVEPEFFMDLEVQMDNLTELIVTKDMPERRRKMIDLSDMFIAFPGGIGTAEEISEVICAGSLGHHDKIYGYYNVNGFYNFAKEGYDLMLREGFLMQDRRDKILFWDSLEDIEKTIKDITK